MNGDQNNMFQPGVAADKPKGSMIGTIIVILIIVIGAIYLLASREEIQTPPTENENNMLENGDSNNLPTETIENFSTLEQDAAKLDEMTEIDAAFNELDAELEN